MHHKVYGQIHLTMMPYTTKGKKSSYKKKQMKRLVAILEDVFRHENTQDLNSIGRKQLIGYWRRTEHEKINTRREKYMVLKRFFELYNPKITVPMPHS